MTRMTRTQWYRNTALALPVLALAGWHGSAQAWTLSYGGRATVVNANAHLGSATARVVVSDTGEMDPNGTARDATVASIDNPPPLELHLKTLSAHTVGYDRISTADADVQSVEIDLPGYKIVAGIVQSYTQATCTAADTPAVDGGASVVDLKVNGMPVRVLNTPNQKIPLGLATIIINEQTHTANSISVNAIHVTLPGLLPSIPGLPPLSSLLGADVVISHAESSIQGCDAGAYPLPYISSFSPASGKLGTVVTLNGNSFNGVTQAWVGSAKDAKVKVLSATQAQVTVPADATTGAIGIGNAGNWAFTATPFTVTH